MRSVYDVLEELLTFQEREIDFALLTLMLDGKIDFVKLNGAYVQCLEEIRKDQNAKLSDANGCTLALLHHFQKENKSNSRDIHWALFNLNESDQFSLQKLNEKFGYDREKDKELSTYYRNKNRKEY